MASFNIDSKYVTVNEDGTVTIDARAFEGSESSETKPKKKGGKKDKKKKGKKSLLKKVGLPVALVGGGIGAGALIMALASNNDDTPALPDNERRDADTF